jgi:hypothetical protein
MGPLSENFTNAAIIRKMGLNRMRARAAAVISKLRFAKPPVGRVMRAWSDVENGEPAERVADFIE